MEPHPLIRTFTHSKMQSEPQIDGERLLPLLSDLRREVRGLSKRAHREVLALASRHPEDSDEYWRNLSSLFENWIGTSNGRIQVLLFASAAELGLDLLPYAERCHQAMLCDGSDAVRFLYWAASRRIRGNWWKAARELTIVRQGGCVPTSSYNRTTPAFQHSVLCEHCVHLRLDPRCAEGHKAMRPTGVMHTRTFSINSTCQTHEHRCGNCSALWSRFQSVADPFIGWARHCPGDLSSETAEPQDQHRRPGSL